MVEALKRLWQAMQQLGSGQDGSSPAASGDLMQQLGAMQTYWRAFLQEKLQDGAGPGADGTALTDVDQFMMPDAESVVPDATLADLDEWMDEPESDAPDALLAAESSREPGGDGIDWLDQYLNGPGDDDSLDDLDLLDGA